MLQCFGLMGLFDIPLNPANTIVLPLILGIGEDYGVHILHEFREQKDATSVPNPSRGGDGDSLTTIVGFGALMIASHQGLQSLGRVLIIGVSCCLFTAMVMLPALLTLISWNRRMSLLTPWKPTRRSSAPVRSPAASRRERNARRAGRPVEPQLANGCRTLPRRLAPQLDAHGLHTCSHRMSTIRQPPDRE